jgi:phenylalanine ammonia-lyase
MPLSKAQKLYRRVWTEARLSTVGSLQFLRLKIWLTRNYPGVNTGFGGSADTRTDAVEELQESLLQMLQFGIISEPRPVKVIDSSANQNQDITQYFSQSALPLNDPVAATCMPESWVRASMLIRLNSLASGFSGVKKSTAVTLLQLLRKGITPRIPIRGSISASGDLSPLSYIGGVMQGKPALSVWIRDEMGNRRLKRADVALAEHSIQPIKLGAKEGLAVVNGTATSVAVGSLALHEVLGQAALSQVLTAMSVEALCGTDESFDPFFGQVRPHPGQIEVAKNIHAFLQNSKLVRHGNEAVEGTLRQDRYSIRTASQWIGPILEDLQLAHQQLTIEMNSVTDNPLINPNCGGRMLHGGNFQAKAVTSAMEKTRQAVQTIGQMLFAQCTELINPVTNRGLPPNLIVDEPSDSFIWKGTDILIAALQSELGFLANPVGSHVQIAEMGNQAINSLALISARYTLEAVEVLSQMSAAHLVAVCQALDLRAMNMKFLDILAPEFHSMIHEAFSSHLQKSLQVEAWQESLWLAFQKCLDQLTSLDSPKRFLSATKSLQPLILESVIISAECFFIALQSWTERFSSRALELFNMNREAYYSNPDATPYLGNASCRMYKFLRERLGVPFIRNETISTPKAENGQLDWDNLEAEKEDSFKGTTMGDIIGKVYDAIRTGALYPVVMDSLAEIEPKTTSEVRELAQLKLIKKDAVENGEPSLLKVQVRWNVLYLPTGPVIKAYSETRHGEAYKAL